MKKFSAPARTPKYPAARLPDHELIRLDAAAHPERTPSEHEAAARTIAGWTYVEDLRRISPAAQTTLSRELEDEEMALFSSADTPAPSLETTQRGHHTPPDEARRQLPRSPTGEVPRANLPRTRVKRGKRARVVAPAPS